MYRYWEGAAEERQESEVRSPLVCSVCTIDCYAGAGLGHLGSAHRGGHKRTKTLMEGASSHTVGGNVSISSITPPALSICSRNVSSSCEADEECRAWTAGTPSYYHDPIMAWTAGTPSCYHDPIMAWTAGILS